MLERIAGTFALGGPLRILPKCTVPLLPAELCRAEGPTAVLRAHAGRFRLICLCRYYAHKNLEAICDTFERAGDLLKDVVVFLTIAPNQHPHVGPLLERIGRSGLADRILNLGPIPETDIAACLANCEGFLLPTKMESFSGAYLDAMQCGVPILTSDLDFARCVCGEAADYFDPCSPRAIAHAIIRLKSDPSLRQRLIDTGRDRLSRLYSKSWAEVAAKVVADLKMCVGQPMETMPVAISAYPCSSQRHKHGTLGTAEEISS